MQDRVIGSLKPFKQIEHLETGFLFKKRKEVRKEVGKKEREEWLTGLQVFNAM